MIDEKKTLLHLQRKYFVVTTFFSWKTETSHIPAKASFASYSRKRFGKKEHFLGGNSIYKAKKGVNG